MMQRVLSILAVVLCSPFFALAAAYYVFRVVETMLRAVITVEARYMFSWELMPGQTFEPYYSRRLTALRWHMERAFELTQKAETE